jgi:hypothetical protein
MTNLQKVLHLQAVGNHFVSAAELRQKKENFVILEEDNQFNVACFNPEAMVFTGTNEKYATLPQHVNGF